MRLAIAALVLTAAAAAHAQRQQPIDLDSDEGAVPRLAAAAGACQSTQPAFIRTWCRQKRKPIARFARRMSITARDAGKGKLAISVPVVEHGKGFVSSLVRPPVTCDATSCMPAANVDVVLRTKVAAADVRSVLITFNVAGMWRDHQWWGPTTKRVEVTLYGEDGAELGTGRLVTAR